MNNETITSMSGVVDLLSGHLSVIDAKETEIAAAKATAAELNETLKNIELGRGDASGLPALRAQIQQNNAAIERLETQRSGLLAALSAAMHPDLPLAHTFLRELYNYRVGELTTQVRPHCKSDKEAEKVATEAHKELRRIAAGSQVITTDKAATRARQIVRYFEEYQQEA